MMMKRFCILLLLLMPMTGGCAQGFRQNDSASWEETTLAAASHTKKKKWRQHKQAKRILVDAGHGGTDFGTYSLKKPRYHEKFLALATTLMVRDHLKKMGYDVILSRQKDTFISLNQRVALAHKHKADLFVSVHYNSAPSTKAHGIEIFYYPSKKDKKRANKSKKLAQSVIHVVTKNTKAKSRGVKTGNFAVIRDTRMPAILVEGGFLTNDGDLNHLKDPKYLNRIAWGIAKGVDDYLKG